MAHAGGACVHEFPFSADRAKAWCLLLHAEASFSHGGQGLVPPYTRGVVSLSLTGGQGESLVHPYTRESVSLSLSRSLSAQPEPFLSLKSLAGNYELSDLSQVTPQRRSHVELKRALVLDPA